MSRAEGGPTSGMRSLSVKGITVSSFHFEYWLEGGRRCSGRRLPVEQEPPRVTAFQQCPSVVWRERSMGPWQGGLLCRYRLPYPLQCSSYRLAVQ